MNTITEHEALTNMARGLNLTIHEKHETDGRKKIKEYFAQRDRATLSPVLPFEKLNLFLMGWRRLKKHYESITVVIDVRGGVAEVVSNPENINVVIKDWDNIGA